MADISITDLRALAARAEQHSTNQRNILIDVSTDGIAVYGRVDVTDEANATPEGRTATVASTTRRTAVMVATWAQIEHAGMAAADLSMTRVIEMLDIYAGEGRD